MIRLLRVDERGEFVFQAFKPDQYPSYAILSHTWGSDHDEVTFDDVLSGTGKEKAGWQKLLICRNLSAKDKLEYFWIDTCCIDKRNEAELAMSIRSMYQWYATASICYALISDASAIAAAVKDGNRSWSTDLLRGCRWFTRGWTLQELLAAKQILFYADDTCIGSRASLCARIHEVTGIDVQALNGEPLGNFPHRMRLAWAEHRQTSLPEDRVYCLMGICGVTLSPRYGEGFNEARRRLESKIVKLYGLAALTSSEPVQEVGRAPRHVDRSNLADSINLRRNQADFMEWLNFDSMQSRITTINNASHDTCEWILTHPQFVEWLTPISDSNRRTFLWIKGKPGTGKSVLVKYLDARISDTAAHDDLCISFFFNARGHRLERSPEGMYRAMCYKLLKAETRLQDVPMGNLINTRPTDSTEIIRLMQTVLRLAVKDTKKRRIYFFIDALDECREDDVQSMVDFWQKLSRDCLKQGSEVLICFASRHYPIIEVSRSLQLVLENQPGHAQDIMTYISANLKVGTAKQSQDVSSEMVTKANGVFLWTVLVVSILNKEFRNGSIFRVKQRLQETPKDLTALFQDMITRDGENPDELLLCLRWIQHAQEPLTLQEFYFAMWAGIDPSASLIWSQDEVTTAQMHNFLLTSSKGLAELTRGDNSRVQFIHEAVNDFLGIDEAFNRLAADQHAGYYARSHETLKQCCERAIAAVHDIREPFSKERTREIVAQRYPLMRYALTYVLRHADNAAVEITQHDFVNTFNITRWQRHSNVIGHTTYGAEINLAYLCAERGLDRLLSELVEQGYDINAYAMGTHFKAPLVQALVNKHSHALQLMLQQLGLAEATHVAADMVKRVESKYQGSYDPVRAADSYAGLNSEVLWRWAVLHGFEELALHLLRNVPALDLIQLYKDGRTGLSLAVQGRSKAVVQHILAVRAGITTVESFNIAQIQPPLSLAIQLDEPELVQVLLDAGEKFQLDTFDLGRYQENIMDEFGASLHDNCAYTPRTLAERCASGKVLELLNLIEYPENTAVAEDSHSIEYQDDHPGRTSQAARTIGSRLTVASLLS